MNVLSVLAAAIRLKVGTMKVSFTAQDNTWWELDLILLAGCIALFFAGAGGMSFDSFGLGL